MHDTQDTQNWQEKGVKQLQETKILDMRIAGYVDIILNIRTDLAHVIL